MIAALDPGRDKCGFAVLEENGSILQQRVIETSCLEQEIDTALAKYTIDVLVMGNGTTSQQARQRIDKACPQLRLLVVDEYRTTELAKKAYWKANPPRGWRWLLPVSMQVPPVPVDDFVAVILARRYLADVKQRKSKGKGEDQV